VNQTILFISRLTLYLWKLRYDYRIKNKNGSFNLLSMINMFYFIRLLFWYFYLKLPT